MKTRLLFLMIFISSVAKAQIQAPSVGTLVTLNITQSSARLQFNVNRNGSNTNYSVIYSKSPNLNPSVGQTPNGPVITTFGWQTRYFDINGLESNTTYYWQVTTSNGLGVTRSVIASFVTLGVPALPAISSVSTSNITINSAKINYELIPNIEATTSIIKYGLSDTTLTNQVTGLSATGNTSTSGSVEIANLLQNTQYFYQIEATNSFGTVVNNGSFQTALPPQIIANYTFDNTLNDVNGANPFASQTGMQYGNDRSGNVNKALYINGTGTTVSLTNLPVGNSSRTFSIWIKPTQFNGANRIFSYGTPSGTAAYGASFVASRIYNFSWDNNLYNDQSTSLNVWKHIVCTYEQSTNTAKLYTDGNLITENTLNWNTANNGILYLGSLFGEAAGTYVGYLDDLQIYNYALSQTEITNLYTNNSVLSTENFNQNILEVSLYPNPASNNLTVKTEQEIKTIEIYTIQGQRVKISNQKQLNVSDLAAGLYLVKIQDFENNSAIKKIVIK